MNLFKQYEEMKKSGQLITIGSIWGYLDFIGVVTHKTEKYIEFECCEDHELWPKCFTFQYRPEIVLDFFTRIS